MFVTASDGWQVSVRLAANLHPQQFRGCKADAYYAAGVEWAVQQNCQRYGFMAGCLSGRAGNTGTDEHYSGWLRAGQMAILLAVLEMVMADSDKNQQ